MRHLFIVNPAAGRKDRSEAIRSTVESLLLTDPYDVLVTEAPGDATVKVCAYLRGHADDFVRVYACGGDGTLCETANGVWESGSRECAVGVVPIGSGNDFAKSFDVPADRFCNLRELTRGDIVPIDLLHVSDCEETERISLNIVSAGFDAAVCKGQEKFKNWPLVSGSTAYNMSLAQCVFTKTKNHLRVIVDGEEVLDGKKPLLFAIAANGRYYGGGFKASPYSDLSDGLLDFVAIDTVPKLRFVRLVGKFRAGRHIEEMQDVVTYKQCKTMQICAEGIIDMNIDGEIVPMRDPTIKIVPGAINVIVPKDAE